MLLSRLQHRCWGVSACLSQSDVAQSPECPCQAQPDRCQTLLQAGMGAAPWAVCKACCCSAGASRCSECMAAVSLRQRQAVWSPELAAPVPLLPLGGRLALKASWSVLGG